MKLNLKDVYTSDSFVGYVDEMLPEFEAQTMLKSLFPDQKITGLDFSYIKRTNGAIELTAPSAFDAEPIAQQRPGFDAMKGELPLFRRKMVLSEKERQKLQTALLTEREEGVKSILREIYDDQMTLVKGARMTMEFLRSRVLMDGKITIESKGGAVNFDYKVPTTHKFKLTGNDAWTHAEAKIATKITEWLDKVEADTGVRPDTMIMNRNTFRVLRNNPEIRANIVPLSVMANANVSNSTFIADEMIASTLKAMTGLKEIKVYNSKVQMDGKVMDLIEDKKIAIYPSSMPLGKTLIGISPAEFSAQYIANAGNEIAITAEGIAVNAYVEDRAPYTSGTEVEFIAVPSFEGSDFVIQAEVIE